ncbi:MgtC/SapB family protein [Nonomuraea soli]|uniref:Putative Mg2+ transporter-C (MgtC) family protein n=1 Tax=Nonomuraea soli TaxID=1032476 RepID=A0A7W0CEW2_9ACTN|nr:MgtC/SapB family protein [Nonomuraea soli]MBA2889846.1 putative Mg2+ transporter-C (MgtC) family protein [Nonomuraea soli]
MADLELMLRLIVAGGLGAVIGMERQWRARMAGIRTNLLVAVGSALFVLLSAYGFSNDAGTADPTRVAAQIVSGIGFLGAGVILREGFNIRGLNTAATLWCAAAVGSLAGAGMFVLATAGTLLIVGANTLMRPLGRFLDRRRARQRTRYRFEVLCPKQDEAHVRSLIVAALTRPELRLRSLHSHDADVRGQVEVHAMVDSLKRDEGLFERATSRLSLEPSVTSVTWTVEGDDDDEDDS